MSAEHSAEKDALLLRALRYAQSHAVTERARGRYSEERNWLDMCAPWTLASHRPVSERCYHAAPMRVHIGPR